MNTSSFWFEGAGGPGPSPTPVPGTANSLRFRGAQWLQRSGTTLQADSTISFWFKYAMIKQPTAEQMLFGNSDSNTFFEIFANSSPNSDMLYSNLGGYGGTISGSPSLRDPSAWYHLVVQSTASSNTVWLNGVQVATGSSLGTSNYTNIIGKNSGSSNFWNGYMADWYCIDGQALQPTAFGRENNDGVWVPREVDFTPATMRWSDFLTVQNGTIDNGPLGATAAFNGDLSDGDGRCFTSTGADLTWAPPVDNPATFTTTLEIFNTNQPNQQNISWNGNTVNPNGGWVTIFTDPSPDPDNPNVIDVNQPLVIDSIGAQRAELYAVRLDGEIVLNPFMWSADLFADDDAVAPPFNTTATEFNAANPSVNAFNGNNGNFAGATTNGSWLVFRPREAINVSNQIRFQANFGLSEVWINEVEQTITLDQELCVFNFDGNLENLAIRGNPDSTAASLIFLQIDGQPLIDGVNNSYGANGFHLDFADPNDIGADTSGNGNDFTATGFELTDEDDVDYDSMTDSPTQNYATGNPINMPTATREYVPSFANLGNNQSTGGVAGGLQPTMPWDATQQWYFEVKVSNYPFNSWFGFNGNPGPNAQTGTTGAGVSNGVINWSMNGGSALGTMAAADGPFNGITWTPNYTVQADVIAGWEWDGPNRRIRYYENGVLRSTSSQWAADSFETANFFFGYNASPTTNWTYNFGQQPFTNRPAALNDTTELQTQNLPEPTIPNGRDHFQVITGPGAGPDAPGANQRLGAFSSFLTPTAGTSMPNWDDGTSANAFDGSTLTFAGTGNPGSWRFAPDTDIDVTTQVRVFSLSTAGTVSWNGQTENLNGGWVTLTAAGTINEITPITATTIGGGQSCFVNAFSVDGDVLVDGSILAVAEQTFANGLYIIKSRTATQQWQFFDTINGEDSVPRSEGPTTPAAYFDPTGTALAWCWNAPDAFTNDDVTAGRRNEAAEFSIINYTGNGNNNRRIAHGLDTAPGLMMLFNPDGGDIKVWINGLTGTGTTTQNLILNTGEVASDQFSAGTIHAPDNATDFIVGLSEAADANISGVNADGDNYRAFIWAPVPGYSAFGSLAGNSDTNGPFIYTGFRPALVWIQCSTEGGGDSFFTADTTCQLFNPYGGDTLLNIAQNNPEGTNSARNWDMLSNGFKIRSSSGSVNGGTVVWAAWASNPFGGNNVSPANAH